MRICDLGEFARYKSLIIIIIIISSSSSSSSSSISISITIIILLMMCFGSEYERRLRVVLGVRSSRYPEMHSNICRLTLDNSRS